MLFVGSLEKNWLGQWKLSHSITGDETPLGSTNVNIDKNGVILGNSGVSQGSKDIQTYFFGLIKNPNVERIQIELEGKLYKDLRLINTGNERVFPFKKDGDMLPYTYKVLNNEGNVIYEGQ